MEPLLQRAGVDDLLPQRASKDDASESKLDPDTSMQPSPAPALVPRICAMLSQSLTIPRRCSHSGVARDDRPLLESTRVLGFDCRLDSCDVAPGCRASQLRYRHLLGERRAVQHLHFTVVCSRRYPSPGLNSRVARGAKSSMMMFSAWRLSWRITSSSRCFQRSCFSSRSRASFLSRTSPTMSVALSARSYRRKSSS